MDLFIFFADCIFCIVVNHNAEDEKDPWLGLSFAATGRLAKHLRRRRSEGGLYCYIYNIYNVIEVEVFKTELSRFLLGFSNWATRK